MFKSVTGGFEVSAEDRVIVNRQRALTMMVNDNFIQVGAVFLKPSVKSPIDENWAKSNYRDTNLQSWIDQPEHILTNAGFNLQQGWMDVDIDADDPEYNRCMVAAMNHLGIDTRFKFGRKSVGTATHVMVQLPEDEASNFEELTRFEPKEFRIDGKRFHTQLRSYPTNLTDAKNLMRSAKQTVMPGSIYLHKKIEGAYDISVWYDRNGEIATEVQAIAATTPRRVSFNQILRAIAFATFLYSVQNWWIEGSRQSTAVKVGGWLARIVKDGQAMNNHEIISADVFCPVDTDEIAESLIEFVCGYMGDEEAPMRVRQYRDAVEKLERNPDAKIPGWPALEALMGPHRVASLRATFTPGSDVSILTKMSERYIFDDTDANYIDRNRHRNSQEIFVHEPGSLERRHIDETVMIAGKPKKAFTMFETSKMRIRVAGRTMYPDYEPGAVLRVDRRDAIVGDDAAEEDTVNVFNTWRGWPILPPDQVNADLLAEVVAYTDKLFGLLSQENPKQIAWLKEWIAWTFQFPGKKQQIAPVIVGGQGVGKSFFGNIYLMSIMGSLWGSSSPAIIDNKFNVGPFLNKMVVFVDEVKFHNESGTDEVKKLIRSTDFPGMEKFGEGRNYKIYSRLVFASNKFDMAIGQSSVTDRALFYMKTYDHKFMGMTDMKFREWADTLKPWFDKFGAMLERMDVREHLVHYYMTYPANKHHIESIADSAASDPEIVGHNMRPSRRVAKYIIEEGRIHDDLSLEFPFALMHLSKRIQEVCEVLGIRVIRTDMVLQEFRDAGLLVEGPAPYRFKHRIADTVALFGDAINAPLDQRYEWDPEDFGENTNPTEKKKPKGAGKAFGSGAGVVNAYKF